MAATVQIYALFDPRGGGIRYIGKTVNAARRLKEHLHETRRKTPLYNWIAKLRKEGITPCMAVIANCITDNWEDVERELITQWREDGQRLLNVAEGGEQPYCPPEIRSANGRRNSASRQDTVFKRKIWELKRFAGAFLKDKHVSDEAKELAREKMRYCAAKRPEIFGSWASI